MIKSLLGIAILTFIFLPLFACSETELKGVSITKFPQADKDLFVGENVFNKQILDKIEEFEAEPRSEQAHCNLIDNFLVAQKFELAQRVLSSLRALNPESKRAAVYTEHIKELEALNGEKISREMRKRHWDEISIALEQDVMNQYSSTTQELLKTANKLDDVTAFIKKAEEHGKMREAELQKRYPNICQFAENNLETFELQSEIRKIERNKGTKGLAVALPELLKEKPGSEILVERYLKFLFREKQFDGAVSFFNSQKGKMKNTIRFSIMAEAVPLISKASSIEQKEKVIKKLNNDLITLLLAEVDCR